MKFQFDRDAMIKEVAIAQEIIANKSPISVLSNVLLTAENNTLTNRNPVLFLHPRHRKLTAQISAKSQLS